MWNRYIKKNDYIFYIILLIVLIKFYTLYCNKKESFSIVESSVKPSLTPSIQPNNNDSRLCIYDNIFYHHEWLCKKA
jgi:hypothetical protein